MKRFLSLALALMLGLAMIIPAFAADAADPHAPIITQQPKKPMTILAGNSITLEVAASLPAGSNGTLSYAWYDYDWKPGNEAPSIATGAKATIKIPVPETNWLSDAGSIISYPGFCAVVTNTYVDDEGVIQTALVKSDFIWVEVYTPFGKFLSDMWKYTTENRSLLGAISMVLITLPIAMFTLVPMYGIACLSLLLNR